MTSLRIMARRPAAAIGRAFTVLEILVVVTIITIIVLIALPRFSSMLYEQEEQLAVGLLRAAMKTGRDAALRSGGEDTAIVFFYRPMSTEASAGVGGRLVMVPYIRAGRVVDDPRRLSQGPVNSTAGVEGVERDVFVPLETAEPIVLPRNWTVRGYAPPNTMQDPSNDEPTDPNWNWYEGPRYSATEGNWVFPETDFYPPGMGRAGNGRQTFMVRFRGGTGEVVSSPNSTVLVLDVRPSFRDRSNAMTALFQAYDRGAWTRKTLRESGRARQEIFGREGTGSSATLCSDVVMTRPVVQLALCDETKLAAALGVEVHRGTGCLYRPAPADASAQTVPDAANEPTFVTGVNSLDINRWIEGDTDLDDTVEGPDGQDQPQARLFHIERYTGLPRQMEVQP